MQWRPGQLPLLADAIEDFYSPSASKGSCWRPRQLVADLLAKQAAGGVAQYSIVLEIIRLKSLIFLSIIF
jgi:hypothetical protein